MQVRDVSLKVSVVFYMHVPFPTSQIFRSLPAAHELLQSMTCADVVGFHAFDHVRHFLNAAKVSRERERVTVRPIRYVH